MVNNFVKAKKIVPQHLLDEIERGNCIPFIGAGVTAEAQVGIPSGRDLAQFLARECEIRSNGQIQFIQVKDKGLDELADEFIDIVDATQSGRGRPELDKFLEDKIPARGNRQPPLGVSSFPFLVNIPWQKDSGSIIITTNWDEMIEDAVEKYARKGYEQITKNEHIYKIRRNPAHLKVIKLHGTIKETNELLITQTQFDRLLASFFTSGLYGILTQMFVTRTMVFAGYGLQDQTVRLVNALIMQPGHKKQQPHYAVMGEAPDPILVNHWKNLGIEILPLNAREFFRYIYSETNQFINRDEQRKLDRLKDEPLCAFVGPAGVGKSYLLRRIANDLNASNGRSVHSYARHLHYKFPATDNRSPEDRCVHFLKELAAKVDVILKDYEPALEKADYILAQAKILRERITKTCLLLIDCSGKLDDLVLKMLDTLLENAQMAVGFNAIVASRSPLELKGNSRRVFKKNTEWLAPFAKGHIALCLRFQALLEADCHLDKSDLDAGAGEIYRITRGHPQAVKIVLERMSENPNRLQSSHTILQYLRDEAFALNNEIVSRVVLNEMLSEVKDQVLIEILRNALCLFRKINASIIQDMMDSRFWRAEWKNTFHAVLVLKRLQDYYIADLSRVGCIIYYNDPVIRRIFSQQMRHADLDRFLAINVKTTEMFVKLAKESRDEWQRTYIIESLFHKLHASAEKTASAPQRFEGVCILLRRLLAMLSSADASLDQQTLRLKLKLEFEDDQEFMDDFVEQFGLEKYEEIVELIH